MENIICGLIISHKSEVGRLMELCVRHNIPLTYPNLFTKKEKLHHLWMISFSGVGLIGTCIMFHFKNDGFKICHGVAELEQYLKN